MKTSSRHRPLCNKILARMVPALLASLLLLLQSACSNVNEDESVYPRDLREGLVVLDTCPKADQENISTDGIVRILFNKDLDPSTVHNGSIVLGSGRMFIRGNVFYDDRIVTYVPTEPLEPNSLYVIYLTTSLRDSDGFAVSDRIEVVSFKTGDPGVYTCR